MVQLLRVLAVISKIDLGANSIFKTFVHIGKIFAWLPRQREGWGKGKSTKTTGERRAMESGGGQ